MDSFDVFEPRTRRHTRTKGRVRRANNIKEIFDLPKAVAKLPKLPVALDIETVGRDWSMLAVEVQNYLLERARSDERGEQVPNRLGLHPGTGSVVAIYLWYPDKDRGFALVEGDAPGWSDWNTNGRIFRCSETAILREFWKVIADSCGTVVIFHGRPFDAPHLMLRSAILAVEPTRNLLPYRYSLQEHCDLADVLSFWNARRIDGNLDFWCRQFGINSPKADIQGGDVAALYKDRRLEDIARYCLGDARAIARLYFRLKPILKLLDSNPK